MNENIEKELKTWISTETLRPTGLGTVARSGHSESGHGAQAQSQCCKQVTSVAMLGMGRANDNSEGSINDKRKGSAIDFERLEIEGGISDDQYSRHGGQVTT